MWCPECGHPEEWRERRMDGYACCVKGHKYPLREALTKEPEHYFDEEGQRRVIGASQHCPTCNKKRQTTCTACGCGSCLSCGFRFCCVPVDSYTLGNHAVVFKNLPDWAKNFYPEEYSDGVQVTKADDRDSALYYLKRMTEEERHELIYEHFCNVCFREYTEKNPDPCHCWNDE